MACPICIRMVVGRLRSSGPQFALSCNCTVSELFNLPNAQRGELPGARQVCVYPCVSQSTDQQKVVTEGSRWSQATSLLVRDV